VDKQSVTDDTRRWIRAVVIGLNLCPFARHVFDAGLIRYVVSDATDEEALFQHLSDELRSLAAVRPPVAETTLLIHPCALADFLAYTDYLATGHGLVNRLGLRGVIQIASFHPDYCFAGADHAAVENYTNRSPYPMLHRLREESVSQFAGDLTELLAIPRRNVETLKGLGIERVLALLNSARAPERGRRIRLEARRIMTQSLAIRCPCSCHLCPAHRRAPPGLTVCAECGSPEAAGTMALLAVVFAAVAVTLCWHLLR
jgi:hypothetical protein